MPRALQLVLTAAIAFAAASCRPWSMLSGEAAAVESGASVLLKCDCSRLVAADARAHFLRPIASAGGISNECAYAPRGFGADITERLIVRVHPAGSGAFERAVSRASRNVVKMLASRRSAMLGDQMYEAVTIGPDGLTSTSLVLDGQHGLIVEIAEISARSEAPEELSSEPGMTVTSALARARGACN